MLNFLVKKVNWSFTGCLFFLRIRRKSNLVLVVLLVHESIGLCCSMHICRVVERTFIEKVNSRCFCWFPAVILVHQNGAPIWRLHTKLYKGAWNVSANNSETMGHKDLRLGQIVYILVFYNISFSWLLPLDGFQFWLRDSENDLLFRAHRVVE